jgi:hypothetical protein
MRLRAGVLAAVLVAACGDSTAPTMASVAGSYTATTFTVTETGGTTNVLAAGGSISLTLAAAGTTGGRLFVPGGGEGGGDFDEALTGTWTLQDSTVTLDHDADTFLRDMTLTFRSRRQLVGQGTFTDVTVAVVLAK